LEGSQGECSFTDQYVLIIGQIQVGKNGIEAPFLAFPPGSESGSLAKVDSTVITDDEMAKLQEAKMLFGGVEVQWQRMTGQSSASYSSIPPDSVQRTSSENSGTPAPTSRVK